ncbi:MAG: hypothetical protein V1809_03005 [Planctomycetota bacterium]
MEYSKANGALLLREHNAVQLELEQLSLSVVVAGQSISNVRVQEYMLRGAGRRLRLLRRCLSNVFRLFPPTIQMPVSWDTLDEVQINLHAYVINLFGLFENLAWSFVLRHELELKIGDRKKIGFFSESTQKYLPPKLKDYLNSSTTVTWHKEYLKNYRDAMAHRIPLYIPPAVFTPEEGDRYAELEQAKAESIRHQDWDRIGQIKTEQARLGSACLVFLHSFSDDARPRPIYLHPQMLCDAKTVLEFCLLYLVHWHECVHPPA